MINAMGFALDVGVCAPESSPKQGFWAWLQTFGLWTICSKQMVRFGRGGLGMGRSPRSKGFASEVGVWALDNSSRGTQCDLDWVVGFGGIGSKEPICFAGGCCPVSALSFSVRCVPASLPKELLLCVIVSYFGRPANHGCTIFYSISKCFYRAA